MNKSKLSKHTKNYHDDLIIALRDPKECYAYLQVALDEYQEDNDADALLIALRNVAEARGGITKLAKKTHLNRQNLYKALSKTGNPRLDTFGMILKGLGFHLSIQPNG
jgi:probable addiction module antidote protein